MLRPGDQVEDVSCGLRRQRVLYGAWSRRDDRGHLARTLALIGSSFSQQCNGQVLEGDHANAQVHQFGIGQFRNVGHTQGSIDLMLATAFILPSRQGCRARMSSE